MAIEYGFTEKQLHEEFTERFLTQMADYVYDKQMTQQHGN